MVGSGAVLEAAFPALIVEAGSASSVGFDFAAEQMEDWSCVVEGAAGEVVAFVDVIVVAFVCAIAVGVFVAAFVGVIAAAIETGVWDPGFAFDVGI
jgi:hypothetical protein